ncbi:hypothetical protein GDO78_003937 [Eleutherodactylus coqui]|uniref:Uncharacterized protein n=1 Tax=Eleutherodactylus coqui TaxID=57060 RepID=A0A8J6EVS4_ELECQ|nr:hypothetical protein GDO78_003937 [Eleutherodactylus coqui]
MTLHLSYLFSMGFLFDFSFDDILCHVNKSYICTYLKCIFVIFVNIYTVYIVHILQTYANCQAAMDCSNDEVEWRTVQCEVYEKLPGYPRRLISTQDMRTLCALAALKH